MKVSARSVALPALAGAAVLLVGALAFAVTGNRILSSEDGAPEPERLPGEATASPLPPAIAPPGETRTGGYVFEDIRVGTLGVPIPDHVRVWYRIGWESNSYPGLRRCIWTLRDEDGTELGRESRRVVGMSRLPDQAESSHVDVNQSASGQATSSSVECGSSRLDDPAGSYEFTNLKISPSGEREVAVAFNYLWRGEAEPVPQTCTVEVRDGAGVGLGETRFNFLALDAVGDSAVPGTTTTHVGLDEAFSQAEQLAARVECNSL